MPMPHLALADLQHHGRMPALDVARNLDRGQRRAPGLFGGQQAFRAMVLPVPRQRPRPRSYFSSAMRSARGLACNSGRWWRGSSGRR
jgi:hypothetical protein